MPVAYPPHLTAHAEPSAAAYHVHCPACGSWVGGAVALALGPDWWAVTCPRCQSTAPGRFATGAVLPFGPYTGRAVSSLRTPAGLDYLDYLLQTQPLAPDVRQAILFALGWLSAQRALVAAGPDVARFERERRDWLQERAAADYAAQKQSEPPPARPERASLLRHLAAEEARQRGGKPRPPQQFHQYQPPTPDPEPQPEPQPEPAPEASVNRSAGACPAWAGVLGLSWPPSSVQVRKAYRRLSKQHHPDAGGVEGAMLLVNQAHDEAEQWLRASGR